MCQQYLPATPSVGAVEIKINNPTVNAGYPGIQTLPSGNIPSCAPTFVPQMPMQQPYYLPPNFVTQQYGCMQPGMQFQPQMCNIGAPTSVAQIPCPYPYYYPLPPINPTNYANAAPQNQNTTQISKTPENPQPTQPLKPDQPLKPEENLALPQTNNDQAKKLEKTPDQPLKPEETNNEEAKKTPPPPPPLSEEYIKLLEKNLRDDNPDKRLKASEELFKRLKEHESRKDDPALTNLLNVALGDPFYAVRFVALSALKGKYAKPNDKTKQMLQEIELRGDSDSKLSSQVLLELAAPETKQPLPEAQDNLTAKESLGKKLNLQSSSKDMQNSKQPQPNQKGKSLNLISK